MGRFWLLLIFLLPIPTQAAIIINEVAWMGDTDSANNEWIELHNNGSNAVTVDGWVLTDNVNLDIVLEGAMAAGAYAVLERTDDASAPGDAFLIYTGALGNDGRTLSLLNSVGVTVDQVVGGENWEQLGGDNTTKDTAQLTSAGWVTAQPTPGKKNSTTHTIVPEDTNVSKQPSSNGGGVSVGRIAEPVDLTIPDTELNLSIDAHKTAYVNQSVQFTPVPSGVSQVIIDSIKYRWNFGDLSTSSKREPIHYFTHPGTYVVTLYAAYVRHEQFAKHVVTVLPVNVSLSKTEHGAVQVHNNARYEVDLSGYSLVDEEGFVLQFPEHTLVSPGATITIQKEKLPIDSAAVELHDNREQLVVVLKDPEEVADVETVHASDMVVRDEPQPVQSVTAYTLSSTAPEPVASAFQFASTAPEESVIQEPVPVLEQSSPIPVSATSSQVAAAVSGTTLIADESMPYLLMVGVLVLAVVGVYAVRL